jgi:hypothetical protein
LICGYKSPHSDVHTFLDKLEILVDRIIKKEKANNLRRLEYKPFPEAVPYDAINRNKVSIRQLPLFQKNEQVQTYVLINTVTVPTRVTNSSESLIDVMVTNRQFNMNFTEIIKIDVSDHLALLIWSV